MVPLQGHRRERRQAAGRDPKRGRRILPRRMARLQGVRIRRQENMATDPNHHIRRRRAARGHGPGAGRLRPPRVLRAVWIRKASRSHRARVEFFTRVGIARRARKHPGRPAAGLPTVRRARELDSRARVRGRIPRGRSRDCGHRRKVAAVGPRRRRQAGGMDPRAAAPRRVHGVVVDGRFCS